MSVARKLKEEPQPKIFQARMLVTRAEEWWVEAETAERAKALQHPDAVTATPRRTGPSRAR